MKFLRWLKSKYPGKKIGLIWDRTAAHISSEVLDCSKELGIIVELLYAGMTAITQPCDILAEQSYQNDNQTIVICAQEVTEARTGTESRSSTRADQQLN